MPAPAQAPRFDFSNTNVFPHILAPYNAPFVLAMV